MKKILKITIPFWLYLKGPIIGNMNEVEISVPETCWEGMDQPSCEPIIAGNQYTQQASITQ